MPAVVPSIYRKNLPVKNLPVYIVSLPNCANQRPLYPTNLRESPYQNGEDKSGYQQMLPALRRSPTNPSGSADQTAFACAPHGWTTAPSKESELRANYALKRSHRLV